jgi:hypothetical protein
MRLSPTAPKSVYTNIYCERLCVYVRRVHCHTLPRALPLTAIVTLPHTATCTATHSWADYRKLSHCRHTRTAAHCRTTAHALPHCQTLPHCHTMPHRHTLLHCRSHCRTAILPHCRTLPLTAAQPHTATRTVIHYQAHCRTLLCALCTHYSVCNTLLLALPHTAVHCRNPAHTLPYCRTAAQCHTLPSETKLGSLHD